MQKEPTVYTLVKVDKSSRPFLTKGLKVISGFVVLDMLNTTEEDTKFVIGLVKSKPNCEDLGVQTYIYFNGNARTAGILKPRQLAKAKKIINTLIGDA